MIWHPTKWWIQRIPGWTNPIRQLNTDPSDDDLFVWPDKRSGQMLSDPPGQLDSGNYMWSDDSDEAELLSAYYQCLTCCCVPAKCDMPHEILMTLNGFSGTLSSVDRPAAYGYAPGNVCPECDGILWSGSAEEGPGHRWTGYTTECCKCRQGEQFYWWPRDISGSGATGGNICELNRAICAVFPHLCNGVAEGVRHGGRIAARYVNPCAVPNCNSFGWADDPIDGSGAGYTLVPLTDCAEVSEANARADFNCITRPAIEYVRDKDSYLWPPGFRGPGSVNLLPLCENKFWNDTTYYRFCVDGGFWCQIPDWINHCWCEYNYYGQGDFFQGLHRSDLPVAGDNSWKNSTWCKESPTRCKGPVPWNRVRWAYYRPRYVLISQPSRANCALCPGYGFGYGSDFTNYGHGEDWYDPEDDGHCIGKTDVDMTDFNQTFMMYSQPTDNPPCLKPTVARNRTKPASEPRLIDAQLLYQIKKYEQGEFVCTCFQYEQGYWNIDYPCEPKVYDPDYCGCFICAVGVTMNYGMVAPKLQAFYRGGAGANANIVFRLKNYCPPVSLSGAGPLYAGSLWYVASAWADENQRGADYEVGDEFIFSYYESPLRGGEQLYPDRNGNTFQKATVTKVNDDGGILELQLERDEEFDVCKFDEDSGLPYAPVYGRYLTHQYAVGAAGNGYQEGDVFIFEPAGGFPQSNLPTGNKYYPYFNTESRYRKKARATVVEVDSRGGVVDWHMCGAKVRYLIGSYIPPEDYDITPPPAPGFSSVEQNSEATDDTITNDNTLTITGDPGSTEKNTTIIVYDTAGTTPVEVGTQKAQSDGSYSVTTRVLADGRRVLAIAAKDKAGNISPLTNVGTWVIDTTATAPTVTSISQNSGSATDTITNDNTLTIVGGPGTAEKDSVITLYKNVENEPVALGTTTPQDNGSYTITTPTLADGEHVLLLGLRDKAGNDSPKRNLGTWTIDTIAPTEPQVSAVAQDTGESSSDKITNDSTLTISGVANSAEPGAKVTVYKLSNGNLVAIGTETVQQNGAYGVATTALSSGEYILVIKAVDTAGNESPAVNLGVWTIDTDAPASPTFSSVGEDTGDDTDNITSDKTLTITGAANSAEPDSTITVYRVAQTADGPVGNPVAAGSAKVQADGSYSVTTGPLADGEYALTIKAKDIAGNESPTVSVGTWTIETTPPKKPSFSTIETDTGDASDKITKNNTLTITGGSGAATPNTTITVYDSSSGDRVAVGSTTANSDGSYNVTTNVLPQGERNLSIGSKDDIGNESDYTSLGTWTIDTTAPTAPQVASVEQGPVGPTNNVLTISGNADAVEPNSSIKVYDFFDDVSSEIGSTTANSNGSYSVTTVSLADGDHTISLTTTDIAGNESPATQLGTITVNTTPPPPPDDPPLEMKARPAGNRPQVMANTTFAASGGQRMTDLERFVSCTTDETGVYYADYKYTNRCEYNYIGYLPIKYAWSGWFDYHFHQRTYCEHAWAEFYFRLDQISVKNTVSVLPPPAIKGITGRKAKLRIKTVGSMYVNGVRIDPLKYQNYEMSPGPSSNTTRYVDAAAGFAAWFKNHEIPVPQGSVVQIEVIDPGSGYVKKVIDSVDPETGEEEYHWEPLDISTDSTDPDALFPWLPNIVIRGVTDDIRGYAKAQWNWPAFCKCRANITKLSKTREQDEDFGGITSVTVLAGGLWYFSHPHDQIWFARAGSNWYFELADPINITNPTPRDIDKDYIFDQDWAAPCFHAARDNWGELHHYDGFIEPFESGYYSRDQIISVPVGDIFNPTYVQVPYRSYHCDVRVSGASNYEWPVSPVRIGTPAPGGDIRRRWSLEFCPRDLFERSFRMILVHPCAACAKELSIPGGQTCWNMNGFGDTTYAFRPNQWGGTGTAMITRLAGDLTCSISLPEEEPE